MGSIVGVIVGLFLLILAITGAVACGVALIAASIGLLYRGARPASARSTKDASAAAPPASAWRRSTLILGGLLALALSVSCLSPVMLLAGKFGPQVFGYLMETVAESREKPTLDPALDEVRRFVAAERAYQAANGGFFGSPACLARPQECIPGYAGPPFIDEATARLGVRGGFVWTFRAAPSPEAAAEVSSPKLSGYALLGVRAEPFEGAQSVCGDARGPDQPIHVCSFHGRELDAGACPASCIWHSFSDAR